MWLYTAFRTQKDHHRQVLNQFHQISCPSCEYHSFLEELSWTYFQTKLGIRNSYNTELTVTNCWVTCISFSIKSTNVPVITSDMLYMFIVIIFATPLMYKIFRFSSHWSCLSCSSAFSFVWQAYFFGVLPYAILTLSKVLLHLKFLAFCITLYTTHCFE